MHALLAGLAAALCAVVLLIAPAGQAVAASEPARPETELMRGPGGFLVDHTLIFSGADGQEHLIHFTRFGTFDWYFPCQIETGEWSLDADQVLRLSYDNPRFAPHAYLVTQRTDGLILAEAAAETTILAQLVEGDRLPYG